MMNINIIGFFLGILRPRCWSQAVTDLIWGCSAAPDQEILDNR